MSEVSTVCVFGLGEAGSAFASDLADLPAVTVRAFDPDPATSCPEGVERCDDPTDAARSAEVILALTASADATEAFTQAAEVYRPGTLYADASTSSPGLEADLAARAAALGVGFVDVALMTTVPGRGLFTPSLASGTGAGRYVALATRWGVPVEAAGDEAGAASTRKLLRSVVMKGMAALIIESIEAAEAAGLAEETYANIARQMTEMDEAWVRRLVAGTWPHALRRRHEMEATEAMLHELGIEPVMTRSTVEALRRAEAGARVALPAPLAADE